MNVPLLDDETRASGGPELAISFAVPDITEDDIAAVADVLRSGWITTAHECKNLERELEEYLGVAHVVTLSSCTAALETAYAYLQLPAGSRIGVPTWTFVSTALAAVHSGLEPVLLDVDPDTLNLSPGVLARGLDEGLDAVVGVHFGGVPMAADIHELCASAGVPLVEDCAHALGARDHRGMVAGQGTAGACFSFYATKNLTSGEGGALATDDPELARFAQSHRLHGLSHDAWARYHPDAPSGYDLLSAGIKGNLSDVLAALARAQLRRFDAMQERRRALVERYRENLSGLDVRCVPGEPEPGSADHLMVVVLPDSVDREDVVAVMRSAQVSTSVHFQPLHTFTWFQKNATVARDGFPAADALAPRALSLPLHTMLSMSDVDRTCAVLADALG